MIYIIMSGNEHKKSLVVANNVSFYRKNLINKSQKSKSYSFRAENTVEIVDTNIIRGFHE